MGRFLLRRTAHGVVVVLAVSVVVFVVTRLIGDPVAVMLPIDATNEQRAEFTRSLGFDRPIAVQFVEFLGNAATLDLGDSLWQRRPALAIVMEHLPKTFQLVGAGMVLAVLVAVPLGIAGAVKPGGMVDRLAVTSSLAGLSLPAFWLGLMLIVLFGVRLRVLPTSGAGSFKHLILPAIAMSMPIGGRLTMMVRVTMIEELNKPWIKTARAKGLSPTRTIGIHALRNAAVPISTLVGWELIRALSGYAVIVESVFAWPGVGFLAYQTVQRQDLILLQAVVFVVAVMVVVVNVGIDVVYTKIDPRIKVS